MAEVPLEHSRAKLRPLRDKPYSLSASGLAIVGDDKPEGKESTSETSTLGESSGLSGTSGVQKRGVRRPRTRICHLCGTPQLLQSYRLHFEQCAYAWERDEAEKPWVLRRPLPSGPRLPDGSQPNDKTSLAELDVFNREAVSVWKSQALETCPNCRRSFHAKALKAHLKGCHAPKEAFLGSSFIGTKRSGEASRTYRTVRESLERSPRVPVTKLAQARISVEASPTMSRPRPAASTTPHSTVTTPHSADTAPHSAVTTPHSSAATPSKSAGRPDDDAAMSRRRRPRQRATKQRRTILSYVPQILIAAVPHTSLHSRFRRSLAGQRTDNSHADMRGDRPRPRGASAAVEARLSALEAGHVRTSYHIFTCFFYLSNPLQASMQDSLRRIERLLRTTPYTVSPSRSSDASRISPNPASAQPPSKLHTSSRGKPSLVRVSSAPYAWLFLTAVPFRAGARACFPRPRRPRVA